jgi:hypothetical protein
MKNKKLEKRLDDAIEHILNGQEEIYRAIKMTTGVDSRELNYIHADIRDLIQKLDDFIYTREEKDEK